MRRVFVYGLVAAAISTAPVIGQQQPRPGDQPRPTEQQPPRTGTQTDDRQQSSRAGQIATADRQFLTDMAHGNMAEVELGRAAQDKASASEVKDFAERMVDDHSKALNELKQVASDKNVTLPTTIDAKRKAMHDKLTGMSGEQFDRAYMQQMVQSHTETLKKLQAHSKSGQDPDIKAWASKMTPAVEEHLKMAKNISSRAVGTTGTERGSQPRDPGSSGTPTPGSGGQDRDRDRDR